MKENFIQKYVKCFYDNIKTIWKLQKVLFKNWVMIKNKKTCIYNINLPN